MATDDDDRKVKEILDAGTQADLERWFGMPSISALQESGQPLPEAAPSPDAGVDPQILAVRERRARALEAVDPAMLEAHRLRTTRCDRLIVFKPVLESRVDPSIMQFDDTRLPRGIAEPREFEIPEPVQDDMRDCAPQALLRDLHRVESEFEAVLEIVDVERERRVDASAVVAEALKTRYRIELDALPFQLGTAILRQLRTDRYKDVGHELAGMPNRRVTE